MLGLGSLLALCLQGLAPPRLAVAEGRGDPMAMAVAADEEVLLLGQGTTIAVWRAGERAFQADGCLGRFGVEATIVDLELDGDRLFVAGGEAGLLSVDWRRAVEGRAEWRTWAAADGDVCVDAEVEDGRVVALFGALDASSLLVFDRDDGAGPQPSGPERLALPAGTARAVAVRGARAWVAMGVGGLVRVELDGDPRGDVDPGADGDARVARGPRGRTVDELGPREPRPPEAYSNATRTTATTSEPGRASVRDVALGAGHLYAAADFDGLLRLPLDAPWSESMAVERFPLQVEGRPTYAYRVATDGARVAVGTSWGPVAGQDGAPYTALGWMDHRLRISGLDTSAFRQADGSRLYLFEEGPSGLARAGSKRGGGGWRGLELRGETVYEHHAGVGTLVGSIDGGRYRELARHAATGFAVIEALPSLLLPGRLWCGMDPAGSVPREALALDREDRIVGLPVGAPEESRLGLFLGPQWIGDDGAERVLSGDGFRYRLRTVTPEGAIDDRELRLATDPDGARGHTYLDGVRDGDLLAWSRSGSAWGLALSSAADLEAQAVAEPDGPLEIRPRAVVRTHAPTVTGSRWAWEPVLLEPEGGPRLVAIPVGVADPATDPDERARTLLVDVSVWEAGDARVVREVLGPRARGHAFGVAGGTLGDEAVLFVADLVHGVDRYVVGADGEARLTGSWTAPVHPIDGRVENVLDLELEWVDGRPVLWVAAARAGLIALDPTSAEPRELLRVETPGWAVRVRARPIHGRRALLVGDQKAGLRIYR